jgi:hypothetical protein
MTESEQVLTNEELTTIVRSIVRSLEEIVANQTKFVAFAELINQINNNNIESIQNLSRRKTDHTHWWL